MPEPSHRFNPDEQLDRVRDAMRRVRGPWTLLYKAALDNTRANDRLFGYRDPQIVLGAMEAIEDAMDALHAAIEHDALPQRRRRYVRT